MEVDSHPLAYFELVLHDHLIHICVRTWHAVLIQRSSYLERMLVSR